MKSVVLGVAALVATVGGFVGSALAAAPPASAFGRLPAVTQASISPSGQTIAILGGPPEDRMVSLATIDQPGLPILKLGKVETVGLQWVGDEYVLARIAFWTRQPGYNGTAVNYRFERNIALTTQAKAVSRLLEGDFDSHATLNQPVVGVALSPKPRAMVLSLLFAQEAEGTKDTKMKRKGEDSTGQLALWSVDPASGKGRLVERGTFDTVGYEVDLSGEARVRRDVNDVTRDYSLFARPKGKAQWTSILVNQAEDAEMNRLYFGYSDPDDAIYLASEGQGAVQMTRRRLADGVVEPVGAPVKSLSPYLIWDHHRGVAVGVASMTDKEAVEWLDPELGSLHGALSKVFKGKDVSLENWSKDRTRYVVRVDSAASPPVWYLFDKARKELSPLGEEYPELKDAVFGPTRWTTYKARDGLEIAAYLTLPPGAPEAGGKLPLIVLPHGGPVARDAGGFDWLTQFLATRGYAVLRPQFRGSAGFGLAFEKAGRGEWGGKVQTDLLDGVAALAATGAIDPARVCIVGASFGGYAALAGATFHPEAYRCAASLAGIADLGLLIGEQQSSYGAESGSIRSLRKQLADAGSAKLNATSPLKHVADIKAPILLLHADLDTVVPIEQSQKMAEALKAAGKPVEFVTLVGDDHYLQQSSARTQMLESLGAFLAKNLPVTPAS
jgi:dipeptidyl aminopeptidase/acylaminoacyl peptidase